jgi:aminoglycoside phosphotransferase (APT) family kinase protein
MQAPTGMQAGPEQALTAGVAEVLAEVGGTDPGEVSLTPIPGGASRETWLVEAGGRFVLRRDPPGAESLVSQEQEFELVRRAARAGVPVPSPLAFEPLGGRFQTAGVLMAHVAGESVGPRLLRRPEYERARELLPAQLAPAAAAIHSLGPKALDGVLPPPPDDPALAQIDQWERQLDEVGEPLPAVELGLRWLRRNRPAPEAPALVHGDFRLGNFIVAADGLAAVIDWELAHLGDPVEDLGWLCIRSWRFGNDELPVAGVGEVDPFVGAYQAAGGRPVERDRLRFWEAFGNVKWAVICARQAHDHLTGLRRSHELASLGRRICEPEWDLLELIGAPA